MSKNIIVIIVMVGITGLLAGGFFLMKSKENPPNSNPVVLPSPLHEESNTTNSKATYEDSSGFSFTYPTVVKVEDITPQEGSYYTFLKLSKEGKEIDISAEDTKLSKPEDWLKTQEKTAKESPGWEAYGAATLGSLAAKQYFTKDELVTVAIDQGVLYLIQGPKDGGFWENTQNDLVGTFAFAGKDTSKVGTPAENIVDEGEEIVE